MRRCVRRTGVIGQGEEVDGEAKAGKEAGRDQGAVRERSPPRLILRSRPPSPRIEVYFLCCFLPGAGIEIGGQVGQPVYYVNGTVSRSRRLFTCVSAQCPAELIECRARV
jgi:hypothetical protein